jgi:hypothetical protein
MPAPVTAATVPILQQASGYFTEGVTALDQIITQVFESQSELTSTAMITTAGAKFGGAVVQWTEDFNNIRNTLSQMAELLSTTAQKILQNEQNNVALASGLPAADQPGYTGSYPATDIIPGTSSY